MDNDFLNGAIGYQIYLKSFFDSNGDGIGDLVGVRTKLEYLKSLGINFIWVSPFYESPMQDNGYDVSNYKNVAKMYGTKKDVQTLIMAAHGLGIKVVFDVVLNHTSSEHNWFKLSEQKIEPYTNYYIWKDGIQKNGKLLPPNNWQSFFSGSAWAYSDVRNQFYLRIFANNMPDLNYNSIDVLKSMADVLNYFASLGVDGFRLDAVSHIGKDLTFCNSKKLANSFKYFSNNEQTYKALKTLSIVWKHYNIFTMGELGGNPSLDQIKKYFSNELLSCVFSFEQIDCLKNNTNLSKAVYDAIKLKLNLSNNNIVPALFWCNHDYPRLASFLGDKCVEKQKLLAGLMYLLKGVPVIYNGEEIGMTNYPFKSADEFVDVNAKMQLDNGVSFEYLKQNSRDNARTAMQWTDEEFAGFSNKKCWFVVNPNSKTINVRAQKDDKLSLLNFYKDLIYLRKNIASMIVNAKYNLIKSGSVVGYEIITQQVKILVLANFGVTSFKFNKKYDVIYRSQSGNQNILNPLEFIVATVSR